MIKLLKHLYFYKVIDKKDIFNIIENIYNKNELIKIKIIEFLSEIVIVDFDFNYNISLTFYSKREMKELFLILKDFKINEINDNENLNIHEKRYLNEILEEIKNENL